MLVSANNIELLYLLIGLPMVVLFACGKDAARRSIRVSAENLLATHKRLTIYAWLDCVVAVIWGVSCVGLVMSDLIIGRPVDVGYAMLAFVSLIAALLANVEFGLIRNLDHDGDLPRRGVFHRHLGSLSVVLTLTISYGLIGPLAALSARALAQALFVGLVVVGSAAIAFRRMAKKRRESQLLWLLTIAVRNRRNLADEIDELAMGCCGAQVEELHLLAKDIRGGKMLGSALAASSGVLPKWVVCAVKNGDSTGTLLQELEDISKQHMDSIRSPADSIHVSGIFNFILLYCTVIPLVAAFLLFLVAPKIAKIFEGFEVELPRITQLIFDVGAFFVDYWIGCLLVLVWPLSWLVRIGIGRKDGWRNLQQRYLMWMFRKTDTPDILRRIARVIRADQSASTGFSAIADCHQRRPVREAMLEVTEQISAGTDCWEAMHKAEFLSGSDLQLLQAAQRNHNLPWALDELADTRERRLAYRMQVVMQIVHPCVVLTVGAAVGLFVIGFFMPLLKLINDLS